MQVTIDSQALELGIDRVGKKLQKALALTLTDSAKYANADLIKQFSTKIDKPAPFTLRPSGYGVTIAKFGASGADLYSESVIKPAQSAYLKFILDGGTRGLGDAGASRKNVFVPGQRPGATFGSAYSVKPRRSAFGGVPNSESSRLFDKTNAPSSGGGVFWGTIKGRTGFFARPKRTKALDDKRQTREEKRRHMDLSLRQRGPNGRYISSNRGSGQSDSWLDKRGVYRRERYGDLRVANKGVPILLLQRETSTKHHRIVDYASVMNAANERSVGEFAARFERIK